MKKSISILIVFVFVSCSKSDPAPQTTPEPTPTPSNGTITSITGRVWMDRNLGATQVAQSDTDPSACGNLYQWGRGADGHQRINWATGEAVNGTTTTLSSTDTPGNSLFIVSTPADRNDWRSVQNDNLWQGVNGINNPCPAGFRLPTAAEFAAEIAAYSMGTRGSAFASPFKFPAAGRRDISGFVVGSVQYWTSTTDGSNSISRTFTWTSTSNRSSPRAEAYCIRCIQN